MSTFFQELIRRKVLRVCGVYVGIAWMIIESSSVILPLFEVPEWIFRIIVIAGLAGFPVAFVLAWTLQITDQGIVSDEEARAAPLADGDRGRRTDFLVIGVLATALLVSLYLNLAANQGASSAVAARDRAPLPVLIADFDNQTSESLFDGTLEEALRIGIEGAPFITSFPRGQARDLAADLRPGSTLNAEMARLVALKQGIKLIFAGDVKPDGPGFVIQAAATDAQSGELLFTAEVEAGSRLEVLNAMATLAEDIRRGLGDLTVTESDIEDVFSATNLEAVSAYMKAQDLATRWRHDEAVTFYEEAIRQDPNMGRAWSGWAYSEFELGRPDRAEHLWQEMLKRLDTMTEREKLRSLGIYYAHSGNVQKAIENYQALVSKFPADAAGHNNLAVAQFLNRGFQQAMQSGRNVLQIYPERTLYLANYALFAMYAGAFDTAKSSADKVLALDPDYFLAWLPVAMADLAANKPAAAATAYDQMAATGDPGTARARMGQADLALMRGDPQAAAALFAAGVDQAAASDNPRSSARQQILRAEALLATGTADANMRQLLEQLLRDGQSQARSPALLVPAALSWINLGAPESARAIAETLSQRLSKQERAYGQVVQAYLALAENNPLAAIDAAQAGIAQADLWLARLVLGQAYLASGRAVEAMSEFQICLERSGEATALYLDDVPTWHQLHAVHYWLGRAHQDMGSASSAAASYRNYLAPLLSTAVTATAADARKRLAEINPG